MANKGLFASAVAKLLPAADTLNREAVSPHLVADTMMI